jgi:hypothetical protein
MTGRTWPSPPDDVGVQLHRRRAAALRCEPLAVGRRDPLDRPSGRRGPCDFGLTGRELAVEWSRLEALGWSRGEVACVLLPPLEVAA